MHWLHPESRHTRALNSECHRISVCDFVAFWISGRGLRTYFATSTFPLSGSSGHAIMALTRFGLRLTASDSQDADLGSTGRCLTCRSACQLARVLLSCCRKYRIAASSRCGSSFIKPIARLQAAQSNARGFPVLWSWSTDRRKTLPLRFAVSGFSQIAQTPCCSASFWSYQ